MCSPSIVHSAAAMPCRTDDLAVHVYQPDPGQRVGYGEAVLTEQVISQHEMSACSVAVVLAEFFR